MSGFDTDRELTAIDRWDRVMKQLSAEPRRLIVVSLLDAPKERRLPLPDAANAATLQIDPEMLEIELRHRHLPLMADAGSIRWEGDPFYVQRGPNFEEVEAVVSVVLSSIDEFPEEMIDGCEVLERAVGAT